VTVGIDGGGLDDLLGLAVLGREADTGNWLSWSRAWAHPTVLQRHKQEAPRLRDFEQAGELAIVNRIGDDVAEVAAIVAQVHASGRLPASQSIGVDPHGLGGILDALQDAEIPEAAITGISQGWKLTGSIKTVERKLAEGALWHGGAALMAWCVGNARVEPRGNAVMITKQGSGFAKIDPLMALFNAGALMALNPKPAATFAEVW
jgi:phage terminase large subunit-like protein